MVCAPVIHRLWTTVVDDDVDGGASARRLDLDVKVGDDVGMQPELQLDAAELLQGLVEVDLPAIDLDAGLLVHGVGDVDGGHRPEQLALGAGPGLDGDRATLELV